MSTLYTEDSPVVDLRQLFKDLHALIEAKHAALDESGGELSGEDKGAVTRWSNEIKAIVPSIAAKVKKANDELRRVTAEREEWKLAAEIQALGQA